uniref:Uncharacterized protein n=1 Tax=Anopheles atroparvus TaxID=41427 RepID=A0A182IUW1_ANOAO
MNRIRDESHSYYRTLLEDTFGTVMRLSQCCFTAPYPLSPYQRRTPFNQQRLNVLRLLKILLSVLIFGAIIASPVLVYFISAKVVYLYAIPMSIKIMYYIQTAVQVSSLCYVLFVYQFRTGIHQYYFDRICQVLEKFGRRDMDVGLRTVSRTVRMLILLSPLYIGLCVIQASIYARNWGYLSKFVTFMLADLISRTIILQYVTIMGTVLILLRQMNDTLESLLVPDSDVHAVPIRLTAADQHTIEKIRFLQLKLLRVVMRVNGGELGILLCMNIITCFIFTNISLLQLQTGIHRYYFDRICHVLEQFGHRDIDLGLRKVKRTVRMLMLLSLPHIGLSIIQSGLYSWNWSYLLKFVTFIIGNLIVWTVTWQYVTILGTVLILLRQMNDTLESLLVPASDVRAVSIRLAADDRRTIEKIRFLQLDLMRVVTKVNRGEFGILLGMAIIASFFYVSTTLLQIYQGMRKHAMPLDMILLELFNIVLKFFVYIILAYPNRLIQKQVMYYLESFFHVLTMLVALLQPHLAVAQFKAIIERLLQVWTQFGQTAVDVPLSAVALSSKRFLALYSIHGIVGTVIMLRILDYPFSLHVLGAYQLPYLAIMIDVLQYHACLSVIAGSIGCLNDSLERLTQRQSVASDRSAFMKHSQITYIQIHSATSDKAELHLNGNDHAEEIEQLSSLHLRLLSLAQDINGLYGELLLFVMAASFINTNVLLLEIYHNFANRTVPASSQVMLFLQAVVHFSFFVVIAKSNNFIQVQNERSILLLHEFKSSWNNGQNVVVCMPRICIKW